MLCSDFFFFSLTAPAPSCETMVLSFHSLLLPQRRDYIRGPPFPFFPATPRSLPFFIFRSKPSLPVFFLFFPRRGRAFFSPLSSSTTVATAENFLLHHFRPHPLLPLFLFPENRLLFPFLPPPSTERFFFPLPFLRPRRLVGGFPSSILPPFFFLRQQTNRPISFFSLLLSARQTCFHLPPPPPTFTFFFTLRAPTADFPLLRETARKVRLLSSPLFLLYFSLF